MTKPGNISIVAKDQCLWITFQSPIDMDNRDAVEESIFLQLQANIGHTIVIDLSKTEVLFSSGLGLIMRMKKFADDHQAKIFLVNISEKVHEGLLNVGLHKILPLCTNEEELRKNLPVKKK